MMDFFGVFYTENVGFEEAYVPPKFNKALIS